MCKRGTCRPANRQHSRPVCRGSRPKVWDWRRPCDKCRCSRYLCRANLIGLTAKRHGNDRGLEDVITVAAIRIDGCNATLAVGKEQTPVFQPVDTYSAPGIRYRA